MASDQQVPDNQDQNPLLVESDESWRQRPSNNRVIWILLGVSFLGVLLCGGVMLGLLLPAVNAARHAAQRMQRANQVQQVGMALHAYHDSFKLLPPTVSAKSTGEEVFGWRFSISPFVDSVKQWEQFDHEQPWDSAANRRVTEQAPAALQSFSGPPGQTNIFAIVSDGGVFGSKPNRGKRISDVRDGTKFTIFAIELPAFSTAWTSTKNLTPDEAYHAITQLEDRDVAHLLMVDGAVLAVGNDLDREMFDAMLTCSGNESTSLPGH